MDHMEISRDYERLAPADVAVLPVYAIKSMDGDKRKTMRRSVYDLFLEKGYAPVAIGYTDDLLYKKGLHDLRLAYRNSWNAEPFKKLFFCDGVVMISIESFREPGSPDGEGIEIWGKIALFDAETMGLLYENHIRRNLLITDPGSRQKYLNQAILDFSRELVSYLPDKPEGNRDGESRLR